MRLRIPPGDPCGTCDELWGRGRSFQGVNGPEIVILGGGRATPTDPCDTGGAGRFQQGVEAGRLAREVAGHVWSTNGAVGGAREAFGAAVQGLIRLGCSARGGRRKKRTRAGHRRKRRASEAQEGFVTTTHASGKRLAMRRSTVGPSNTHQRPCRVVWREVGLRVSESSHASETAESEGYLATVLTVDR